MTYGNLNVDTVTTSTAGGVLGAGNASTLKNRIINGAMVIDQRNAGASVTPTAGVYTLDRWYCASSISSKYSVQQNAGSVTPPVGFTKYLGFTSLSAYSSGSTDNFNTTQAIEGFNIADLGWGTANAKTVTLSFQVYSSLTGTFSGSLSNGSVNRSYPFTFTISSASTWTTISVTVAGDTTGTWSTDNSAGLNVTFNLGCGSTLLGTAGAWAGANYKGATGSVSVVGTSGATFYITGVQLEVGSSATGFEYRQYQQELALCQRYFMNQSESLFFQGISSGRMGTNLAFPVQMRATPTATLSSTTLYWESLPYATVGSLTLAVIDLSKCSSLGGALSITGTFSPSPVTTYASSLGGGQITFSAEL